MSYGSYWASSLANVSPCQNGPASSAGKPWQDHLMVSQGPKSLHDSSQLSASTAQGYGGCSCLGLPDSLDCQSLLFCITMGFVLGLNSGSDCSTGSLRPPLPMDPLPERCRRKTTLRDRPQWVSHGLAVRLSKAAQQAAGPTAGDTARGRRLHPCSFESPTSRRIFMDPAQHRPS